MNFESFRNNTAYLYTSCRSAWYDKIIEYANDLGRTQDARPYYEIVRPMKWLCDEDEPEDTWETMWRAVNPCCTLGVDDKYVWRAPTSSNALDSDPINASISFDDVMGFGG